VLLCHDSGKAGSGCEGGVAAKLSVVSRKEVDES
jgi:hypothetical protein